MKYIHKSGAALEYKKERAWCEKSIISFGLLKNVECLQIE